MARLVYGESEDGSATFTAEESESVTQPTMAEYKRAATALIGARLDTDPTLCGLRNMLMALFDPEVVPTNFLEESTD